MLTTSTPTNIEKLGFKCKKLVFGLFNNVERDFSQFQDFVKTMFVLIDPD